MEALWNKLDLQRPTTLTYKVSSREIDANSFLMKVDKIINDLESQEMLHFEAALLGRLIYRMKCKFRNDKGLKNMEKTNRALLNYLKLCLEKDYKYLKECINLNTYPSSVTLPTKQMIEYILVKTQSFAKLMCRVESVSQEAARFLNSRINIGQSWDVSLIALSVISRIWVLSRHLIKKSCDWYNLLYEYSITLKRLGAEWLPKNYNLPFDLKCWLNLPWIDEVLPNISTHEEIKQNIFNLIKPTDDDSEIELDFEIEDISGTPKPSLSINKFEIVEGNSASKIRNKNLSRELNSFPLELIDKTPKPSSSSKFELVEKTSISKTKNRKSSQGLISFPLGITDVGQKISRDAFNSILKKQSQNKQLKKDCQDAESNESEDKSIKKREKIMKARKELKYEKDSSDEKSLDKRKKTLTPDNLKTENDLITFLKPKSYPGMDKMKWKMLKKNVRQFLVDINNSNESVSKKKKLKMVFKKIREWTN